MSWSRRPIGAKGRRLIWNCTPYCFKGGCCVCCSERSECGEGWTGAYVRSRRIKLQRRIFDLCIGRLRFCILRLPENAL